MKFSKLDYCRYLLSSQLNYTLTNLADHSEGVSHDRINRYLRGERITTRLLWDNVKDNLHLSEDAYLIFDDTVLDKRYARYIELIRRQYSGNEHRVIRGIGMVSCVYVNPQSGQFQGDYLPDLPDYLPAQAWAAIRLLNSATQKSFNYDEPCVSPESFKEQLWH
jgi:hypothetical protein